MARTVRDIRIDDARRFYMVYCRHLLNSSATKLLMGKRKPIEIGLLDFRLSVRTSYNHFKRKGYSLVFVNNFELGSHTDKIEYLIIFNRP